MQFIAHANFLSSAIFLFFSEAINFLELYAHEVAFREKKFDCRAKNLSSMKTQICRIGSARN